MAARPLVIDCDPGHDDAVAILLACGSQAVDLKAVTTTFGNCAVDDATRNALQILELAGASHVPVGQGARVALNGVSTLGNYVHGVSGLDGPQMPPPSSRPVDADAVDLLREVIENSPEKVTIAATGPITNIARLVQLYPRVLEGVREIIFMGGSTERGNHTPTAEFNTFADPEALDVVLKSGVPVRMVGLNLTHQALANQSVVERMAAMDHAVGQTCAAWMGFFGDSYNRVWEFDAPPVHDPCTVASIIDSDVIEWRDAFIAVELSGEWTRGTTVVDIHHRYPNQVPNAKVAMTLDVPRYWDLVTDALDRVGEVS